MNKRILRNLIIFIIITLASGWIGVFIDSFLIDQPQGNSLGMGLWLILPFLTALILRISCKDWKDCGIKPYFKGNAKWYASSLIIYPFVTIVCIGLAAAFGYAKMAEFEMHTFLSLAVFSTAGGLVKNIFEEFSWRGYLTPKIIELKINDWLVYIISGLVWALWHTPYYLVFLPDNYFESMTRIGFLLSACAIMICWTVMYVELYRLAKSVWPCVLMHAIEDAFPNVLVITGGFIYLTRIGDVWFNPITGIIATVLFLSIGLLLRAIRIKKSITETNSELLAKI
jgi:membrane protease YdiL (CAAX protease family)